MSTFVYARLTRRDEIRGAPDTDKTLKILTAIIPGEALALHAALLAIFTKEPVAKAAPVFVSGGEAWLTGLFWPILAISAGLVAVERALSGKGSWQAVDWIRMLLAPAAFVAWTLLEPFKIRRLQRRGGNHIGESARLRPHPQNHRRRSREQTSRHDRFSRPLMTLKRTDEAGQVGTNRASWFRGAEPDPRRWNKVIRSDSPLRSFIPLDAQSFSPQFA
jgi:hypothetical protein